MNNIRTSFAVRAFATIVAFFAWVVLSNHCALSAALAHKPAPSANAESSCCKNKPKPADGNAPCPQMPQGCCKTLKVAVPDDAKIPQAAVETFVPVFAEVLAIFAHAQIAKSTSAHDNGPPPDSPTFAELVLNRSLLSHAPPVLA